MTERFFKALVGFLISAILLFYVCYSVGLKEIFEALLRVNYLILIPGAIALYVQCLLRAWRWRYLLPADLRNQASFKSLLDGYMIGSFATYVLPLRAGEFIRPLVLSMRAPVVGFAIGFSSVVVERFFDLLTVLISFSLVVPLLGEIPTWAIAGARFLAVLAASLLGLLLLAAFLPKFYFLAIKLVEKLLPDIIAKTLKSFISGIIQGTRVLRDWKILLLVLLMTTLIWLSCYSTFYLFLFLVDVEQSFFAGTVLAIILALAVAAPSAPGFIGVYQVACLAGFAIFGFNREDAVAYSLVTHLLHYLLFSLYALYFFVDTKITFSNLIRQRKV
ncbi:MAG TPA: lysylphosphatidylglycerol synthase transmembrane domain-containing protein [Oligoflexia bacterium]|mgnify:CR=1 FL=1|nr:lysylphosphatidylglycerol synthase transmembrane domain-containing protein [Oligoflexia bacterium]HMP26707.1 lysylphosphatidylglycerol synthase transmembrane domain-containing protein [Oligoflexia bacterium]